MRSQIDKGRLVLQITSGCRLRTPARDQSVLESFAVFIKTMKDSARTLRTRRKRIRALAKTKEGFVDSWSRTVFGPRL